VTGKSFLAQKVTRNVGEKKAKGVHTSKGRGGKETTPVYLEPGKRGNDERLTKLKMVSLPSGKRERGRGHAKQIQRTWKTAWERGKTSF